MSKKNDQRTRERMHAARVAKEKEEAEKRAAKLAHKAARLAAAEKTGVAAPKRLKRKAKKGVRLRKHVVVRGIKITDAESRRKAKEVLAAEEAMKDLMMDMDGGEEPQQRQRGQQGGGGGDAEVQMKEGRKPALGRPRAASATKVSIKAGKKAAKKAAKSSRMDME